MAGFGAISLMTAWAPWAAPIPAGLLPPPPAPVERPAPVDPPWAPPAPRPPAGRELVWPLAAELLPFEPAARRAQGGFGARLGNDYFAWVGDGNDLGFTNDVEVYVLTTWRGAASAPPAVARLGLRHTVFREDTDANRRRYDLGRLYLDGEVPIARLGRLTLALDPYADAFFRGDLGGKQAQDVVHRLPGINGDTIGGGLDDRYPRARLGATMGLSARLELDLSPHRRLYLAYVLEGGGKLAPLSTGYNVAEVTAGLRGEVRARTGLRLFAAAAVGTGEATTNDPFLRLRGAFTNELGPLWGPTLELGARIRAAGTRWLTLSLRTARNEEGVGSWHGSGPMGWLGLELSARSWLADSLD